MANLTGCRTNLRVPDTFTALSTPLSRRRCQASGYHFERCDVKVNYGPTGDVLRIVSCRRSARFVATALVLRDFFACRRFTTEIAN